MATHINNLTNDAPTITRTTVKWATSEAEWNAQKGRIRQLYLEDNKPLKEVMIIMKREHAFNATSVPRMHPFLELQLTLRQHGHVQEPHQQMGF